MASRVYQLFVVALWLSSMTWLMVEKVLPPLLGGTPPDYDAALLQAEPAPDYWKLSWQDRPIGFAASRVFHDRQDGRELRSAVQFENVPLDALVSQLLGPWTRMFGLAGDADLRISATLGTRVWFDAAGVLTGFQTRLLLKDSPVQIVAHGATNGPGKLDVAAWVGNASGEGGLPGDPVFRQTIDLPPNALVADEFTPRGKLKDLRLGQSWTIPVFRPFPPNSPVQIVAAKAERHEVIFYGTTDVETLVVVYRLDAGSGIRAAREPTALEWVDSEGRILRQEILVSGLRFRFERVPPEPVDPRMKLLDPGQHPGLWESVPASRASDVNQAGPAGRVIEETD